MSDYSEVEQALKARLAELTERAEEIEDDLRHPLDADSEEQAIDLADDEALAGVDTVLRNEIMATRAALQRIEDGTYGTCANCGDDISEMRLKALPTATLCINCA
ncbi:TraR/DksA family transcriptional regulator [Altererythrobacter fulvus]|uniref:TraR/DksA family transcriptional regulator n=1 Tax=Caenibius fulvus TaxID=2126012 RepID=UPI0030170A21